MRVVLCSCLLSALSSGCILVHHQVPEVEAEALVRRVAPDAADAYLNRQVAEGRTDVVRAFLAVLDTMAADERPEDIVAAFKASYARWYLKQLVAHGRKAEARYFAQLIGKGYDVHEAQDAAREAARARPPGRAPKAGSEYI